MNSCSCRRCKSMPTFTASRAGRDSTMFGAACRRVKSPTRRRQTRSEVCAGARLRLRLDDKRSDRILPQRRFALCFSHDGQPIPPEHGGPVRLIIPQLYAWKSAKWVKGVRFLQRIKRAFGKKAAITCAAIHGRGDGERFRWVANQSQIARFPDMQRS